MRLSTSFKRLASMLAVLGCGTCLLSGCTTDQLGQGIDKLRNDVQASTRAKSPNPTPPSGSAGASASGAPIAGDSAPVTLTDGEVPAPWREAISQVESQFGGSAGIAVAVPGVGSAEFGTLLSDVAWSTSKVPVAVAVVREQGVTADVTSAITVSDNAAAEAMWASLGDPATAGQKTNQVLRDGGDTITVVQTERVRPEFTAFGQTQWSLKDQAGFGAQLRCISGGSEVADLMGQISAGQDYGLGVISGAAFKGGWGPDTSGMYMTRQFGLIPGASSGSFVGVAIAVKSADGTYETEQAMLTSIATAIQSNPIAGGTC